MLDVVQIIPRFYPGGAERLVLQYAAHLDPKQFRLHVMSSVGDGALRPLFSKTDADIILGSRDEHGGRWGVWKFLKKELERIQPRIIHTHLMGGDMIGYLWKRIHPETIWISTAHNVEFRTPWIKRAVWKMFLKKVDVVIAVSDTVAEYSHVHFKVPQEKIHTIYNGTDVSVWNKISSSIMRGKTPALATIGRLEEQKGHTYALHALSGLKNLPWMYHIYGQGSLESSLKKEAGILGIADRVIWHGQNNDMTQELKKIDIVIQPSLWEGMSLVVLESMAAGRVVIASEAAGSGIIESGKTGYIVKTANVEDLSETLVQVMENEKNASEVGKNARLFAHKHFDMKDHYHAIESLYRSLITQ